MWVLLWVGGEWGCVLGVFIWEVDGDDEDEVGVL